MIFARKTTWRSRLDLECLDETSTFGAPAARRRDEKIEADQFVDYASKETLGQFTRADFCTI